MTELCKLAKKYNTDKYYAHEYTQHYHNYFNPIKHKVYNLLEIGIWEGASLRMWRDYFPNAEIVGIDIDESKMCTEDRITSLNMDGTNTKLITDLFKEFDIIIDDGSPSALDMVYCMIRYNYPSVYMTDEQANYLREHIESISLISANATDGEGSLTAIIKKK